MMQSIWQVSEFQFQGVCFIDSWFLMWSSLLQEEEEKEKEEEEQARLKESEKKEQKDVALEEMVDPTAKEAEEREKALDKEEQLSELSRALAVLASASVWLIILPSEAMIFSYSRL